MTSKPNRRVVAAAAMLFAMSGLAAAAQAADSDSPTMAEGGRFLEQSGAALYQAICQGCHMPQGQGAKGAGMYPALANNPTLAAANYPVYNVLHGRKGMPGFGDSLSDAQVAEVSNYVRTHFGNRYTDTISAADVRKLR